MIGEADTCRKYVEPKLDVAGWNDSPHSYTEQVYFTDGRIIVVGTKVRRRPGKKADYLLRFTRDFPIAVVEAKAAYKLPSDGLQQAKDYAQILDLRFAYSTNGAGIVEFDFTTGVERELTSFPSPAELWTRYRGAAGLEDETRATRVLTPAYHQADLGHRYYQRIAIDRVIQSVLAGRTRLLLTMATGTGKTAVAFQICWKLWNAGWSRDGARQRPRILYLADRNILVDDPKDKVFAPFGDARMKIENGEAVKSREMYFSTYQAIAEDEQRPGLYRAFSPDFFDLIIVDEAHRGSARDESRWREILEYFSPAVQLGMTATPLRDVNRNTYEYFGSPLYTYSLRQGIEDGFLAPYRVHRIVTSFDATGWRPSQGELDRYGREIPDQEYVTQDFERLVALKVRTEAIAANLTEYLNATDPYAKTIVFCVDQEHAAEMRAALSRLSPDKMALHPDYVCRVTSNEGDVGRAHLGRFQEVDSVSPVVLTTSQLLTTGVDAPTTKNIVIARVVNSMVEFKQIIGRGTRVRDDYGKLYFTILDYTGSASRLFADPEFDGDPVEIEEVQIADDGSEIAGSRTVFNDGQSSAREEAEYYDATTIEIRSDDAEPGPRTKYYVDGGIIEISAHLVYELDPDGRQLRVVQFSDYAGEKVRTLYPAAADLRVAWEDPTKRSEVIAALAERGIEFETLAEQAKQPDADPFDLVCHLAYNAPLRSRRERADRVRRDEQAFFEQYGPQARGVLEALLDKYAEHGTAQFTLPAILQVPPISEQGNVVEIAESFGGAARLRDAVGRLQSLLYAA
ncbi:MAG TPA: DEAD/DEAH box helicase family protein [Candidatus Dormibacteraeota bacterium]|nr:DEAD/DEAH box helicase family protein [Candidatus Dormibacteraeota bacterium]